MNFYVNFPVQPQPPLIVAPIRIKEPERRRLEGALISNLLTVGLDFEKKYKDVFQCVRRSADFFIYDFESAELNGKTKDVCRDSHHIHCFVIGHPQLESPKIFIQLKFVDGDSVVHVRFDVDSLLSFKAGTKHRVLQANLSGKLVYIPNDLEQLLIYLKETFTEMIHVKKIALSV